MDSDWLELERLGEDIHASLYFSKTFDYCYVNNPKAACSSIKKILWTAEAAAGAAPPIPQLAGREHFILNHKPNTFDDWRPWEPLNVPLVKDVSAYFYFTFVRNPFTRTLSAYLDKIAGKPNIHRIEFYRAFDLPDERRLSFGEFLDLVERQPVHARDPHWRNQCVGVGLDLIPYDWIGKYENLEAGLAHVFRIIGLSAVASADNSFLDHATGASGRLSGYYGEPEQEAVRRIYREDFERLGYSVDLAHATSSNGAALSYDWAPEVRHDRMTMLRVFLESLGTVLQDVRLRQIDQMLSASALRNMGA